MFLISHTFTRPLASLVSGVRALEKGDFAFPLHVHSHDELAELTAAFDKMRRSLQKIQQDLLHAERLATIGRMASTISHDLRQPLTTILAYAEFQSEGDFDAGQRKALYDEIRSSVNRMAELISSLLEFSKGQEALRLTHGDVVEALQRTLRSVRARPDFKGIKITVEHAGTTEGWFDFKKLDRAFQNLLQNACEAVPAETGKVQIMARGGGRSCGDFSGGQRPGNSRLHPGRRFSTLCDAWQGRGHGAWTRGGAEDRPGSRRGGEGRSHRQVRHHVQSWSFPSSAPPRPPIPSPGAPASFQFSASLSCPDLDRSAGL